MASSQPVAATSDTRRRVKLYILNEDRQWDDKGTGYVSSIFLEHLKGLSLLVKAESDGSTLLESRIQPDIAYQKQQETLIVWSQDDNYDLALSFQEKAGCDEIWEKICQVQGKDPSVDVTQDIVDESEDEQFDNMPDNSAGAPVELPPCEISKLEEIAELFQNVLPSPIRRERLSVAIENEGYVHKLLELFNVCEDLEILDGLHHLYDIFKAIFMLNKNALFEIMFADDVIYNVIGCLEYDPSLKKEPNSDAPPQRIKHREYLKNQAKFKEVIPITNPDLLAKIHQTYRVSYIQEIVLPTPSVFEENMLTTLSSFIFFNKVEIVSMIQDDEKFLTQLFFSLKEDDTEETKRRDLVLFLKELCSFSQTLQPQNRESFFRTLSNQGILDALEILLGLEADSTGSNHQSASTSADASMLDAPLDPSETPLAQIKAAAIDMFSFIVEFSPSMVREFVLQETQAPLPILQEDDADLLINLVIDQMISDMDPELGGAMQLMGILKILIDPENMVAQVNKTEKTEFLTFFYKRSMPVLVAPILANTTSETRLEKDDYRTAHLQYLVLELLAFCVEHHTYHIRNYVLNKDFLRRVLKLFKSNHAFLALAALRFLRKIIGLKDEFYNRYIIKGNLFAPIIEAFNRNGQRYNLLNSALLEIFEFIRVEDIKSLITHIVETHWEAVKHVDYVQTFKNLKLRYEQQVDRAGGGRNGGGGGGGGGGGENNRASVGNSGNNLDNMFLNMPSMLRNNRFRRDARALEEEEEMWFDQEEPDLDSADSNSARQVSSDEDSSPPNSLQSPPHVSDACDQIRDNAMDGMSGSPTGASNQGGISSTGRTASVTEAASSSSSVEQRELQATFLAAAVAVGMSSTTENAASSTEDDDNRSEGFTSSAANEVVEGPADSIDFSKMVQRNFKSCDDDDDDDEEEEEESNNVMVESRFKITAAPDVDEAAEGVDVGVVCSSTSGSTASHAVGTMVGVGVHESGDGMGVLSTASPSSSTAVAVSNHDQNGCGDVSSGSSIAASAIKHTSECFSSISSGEENGLSSTTSSSSKAVEGSSSSHHNAFVGQMGLDFSASQASSSSSSSSSPTGGVSLVTRNEFGSVGADVVDSSAATKESIMKDACSTSTTFDATRRRLPSIETIDPSATSASSSSLASLPAVSDIIGPSATPPGPFSQLAAGCSNAATVVTSSPLMAAAIEAMAAAAASSGAITSSSKDVAETTGGAGEGGGGGSGDKQTSSAGEDVGTSNVGSGTNASGGNQLLDLSKSTNTTASFLADSSATNDVPAQFYNNSDHCQSSSQVSSSTFYGQELPSNLSTTPSTTSTAKQPQSSPSSTQAPTALSSTNRSLPSQSVSSSSSASFTSSGVSSNLAAGVEDSSNSPVTGQRVGLVDYEGDSDEEEEEDSGKDGTPRESEDDEAPSLKRARLST